MAIYFYSARDVSYGCFSNFSAHGFELNGLYWKTSEHYFQAQKFINTSHYQTVQLAKMPKQAAEIGRDHTRPLRNDWEHVKENVMRQALYAKFTTHHELRTLLLNTGNEPIVENSPIDSYWGCGSNHLGLNRLEPVHDLFVGVADV